MTPPRFLIGMSLSDDDRGRLLGALRCLDLSVVCDRDSLLVAATSDTPVLPLGEKGLVIGHVYAAGIAGHLTAFDPVHATSISTSCGARLAEAWWGDYVAIIQRDSGETALLRSPLGRLSCLFRRTATGLIAASDLDMLQVATGTRPSLDYPAIVRQLMVGSMRRPATGIAQVEEVQGGDRITVTPSGLSRKAVWSPWTFVQPDRLIHDEEDACTRLRHTARACISARTGTAARPLLMLSGGLDSSLVAACLAHSPRDFECLNLATVASAGDERDYARIVARHFGQRLVERIMSAPSANLESLAAVRLPRPTASSFEQSLFSIAGEIAEELDCDAVVDGGGGDNVFGSLQSASPAADCLLDPEGWRHFGRLCRDIGEIAHASKWKVAWRARRRAWNCARPYRWSTDTRFLSADTAALAKDAAHHPWIDDNSVHLPGRAAHIAMIVAAQGVVEDGPYGAKSRVLSPLLAQPLVEHCLSIPSWMWFAGGRNRAAARRAFEGHLPHEIAWRRSKGAPDSFAIDLFERNRATIRDALAGGLLDQAGTIDLVPIMKVIDDPRPVGGTDYSRVMDIFDTEVWARSIRG